MGDFDLKFTAEQLGKDLKNLGERLEAEVNEAVENLAHAAHAQIIAAAQAKLDSTRRDYLNNLKFINLGDNTYLIALSGDSANSTEDGYPGFDMKPGLLGSQKTVEVGSRAGQKWVQKNKKGKKYAAVPFQQRPSAPTTSDLGSELRKLKAFNRQGVEQKITKVFKDDFGKPIAGKVAKARSDNRFLDNLTKFQHVSDSGKVSSIYMTWRMVSEESNGWQHPGYEGLHAFKEAEEYVQRELENIVKTLIK